MKWIGILAVIGGLAGVGLYFGGFVDGKVEVEPTSKAKSTFNQGVDGVAESLRRLKVNEAETTE